MKKLSKEELLGMKKQELLAYCKNNDIKIYSNKNKAYIINVILQSYKSQKKPVEKPVVKKSSKPRMTKRRLLGILKEDIKDFKPSGSYSMGGRIYVQKIYGYVEVDFRHLGRWESSGEDDDWPDWSDKSYDKYDKEFNDWAKRKSWYKRIKTSVATNEKAWVSFQLKIK
ncbi:hypothetical protein LCGC14_0603400 [marine sediment metagenome]|uniref:Uncharacterized protein n=1 Tax=marine sediment metagenome TaxID=412755 RepID=A0A0F9RA54_9ZZZZ